MYIDEYGRRRLQYKILDRPIFIFAPSERCGSTLLQRFLSSHPDVFIWGEQKGALGKLVEFYDVSLKHSIDYANVGDVYFRSGVQGFIANLAPSESSIRNATTSAIRMLYGGFAERWGCKEIRCDASAAGMLMDLFPEVRIIFLVRHLAACVSSLMRWEYKNDELLEVAQRWIAMVHSINAWKCDNESNALIIQFESFLRSTEQSIKELGSFLDLDYRGFDENVLRLRVADHANITPLASPESRSMLELDKTLTKSLIDMGAQEALSSLGYKEL